MSPAKPTVLSGPQIEWLKWLGLGLMLCDHLPRVLSLTPNLWYYLLGRSTMPLFCLALGAGLALRLSPQVQLRILLAALVSQPLYYLVFGLPLDCLNVLFTLQAGVAMVHLLAAPGWPRLGLTALSCLFLPFSDFGLQGAILVPLCYLICSKQRLAMAVPILVADLLLLNPSLEGFMGILLLPLFVGFALFIPVHIPRIRHLFYWAYPGHIALLWALRACGL
jgi:hypothetical protein